MYSQKKKTENRTSRGFTLMELLIVVAVIAILVAIAIPVFRGQTEKAKLATCMANRRSLKTEMLVAYADDSLRIASFADAFDTVYDENGKYVCPSGGTFYKTGSGDDVTIHCTHHDDGDERAESTTGGSNTESPSGENGPGEESVPSNYISFGYGGSSYYANVPPESDRLRDPSVIYNYGGVLYVNHASEANWQTDPPTYKQYRVDLAESHIYTFEETANDHFIMKQNGSETTVSPTFGQVVFYDGEFWVLYKNGFSSLSYAGSKPGGLSDVWLALSTVKTN